MQSPSCRCGQVHLINAAHSSECTEMKKMKMCVCVCVCVCMHACMMAWHGMAWHGMDGWMDGWMDVEKRYVNIHRYRYSGEKYIYRQVT